jgi:DNA-binding transcriptional MocR family regulator
MAESSSSGVIVDRLRTDLSTLAPGARLPSTRVLVDRHRVSPVTVSRALAELSAEGLVITRPGAGTFKAEPPPHSAPVDHSWQTAVLADHEVSIRGLSFGVPEHDESLISLSTGYLHPALMPVRALAAAGARAARRPGVWNLPPESGLIGLRTWVARAFGAAVDPRDVTITPGGQGALSSVLRAIVPAGEPMLVESPTYMGAIAVLRAAGIRPVPVPIDADGIVPELLSAAFERTHARAVLVQPTYQNPTGAVLAPERRAEVLRIARDAGAFIVEDDYARWLGHTDHVPPPLLHDDTEGRVIHVSAVTKVTSSNLRIGAVIARGPVIERVRALRLVTDLLVPRLVQETALEFVSGPGWTRHLNWLHGELAARCAQFSADVATLLPGVHVARRPRGGLHLWGRLPDHVDDVWAVDEARRAGVAVLPGRPFFPAEPAAPYLRLTFSAAASQADLRTGLERLAAAVPALSDAA